MVLNEFRIETRCVRPSIESLRFSAVLISALALFAGGSGGCSKDPETPVQPETPEVVQPTNAALPAGAAAAQPGAVLDVPAGADPQTVTAELEREVRKWILRYRRTPRSFEEFISTTPMQIPPPPPGKKYVLTREMKVVLENR
jgi:hypothetical protein